MKALSIKNPWALLIALGIKDIENRTWRTTHRGKIYIHASAKHAQFEFTFKQSDQVKHIAKPDFKYSCIIGEVDIVDCVQNHPSRWAEQAASGEKPIWNWVLENPILYETPIENVKGKLSLWEYSSLLHP